MGDGPEVKVLNCRGTFFFGGGGGGCVLDTCVAFQFVLEKLY